MDNSFTGNSGPHRIVDKLFGNTRYFVIKSNNYENVQIAKDKVKYMYKLRYSSVLYLETSTLACYMYVFGCRMFGPLRLTMKRSLTKHTRYVT